MRLLALMLVVVASPALADLEAAWDVEGEGQMVISFRDADNIRMDMGEEGYLLLDEGTMYSVSQENGKWMAMDMAEIGQMMGRMGGAARPQADDSSQDHDYELIDTGEKETVAGYEGVIYEVVPGGGRPKEVVVLSDHADVMQAQEAFTKMAAAMAGAISGNLPQLPDDMPGGLLRNGDLTLVSINKEKKPDTWFDLPADVEVQSMRGMMQGFTPPAR